MCGVVSFEDDATSRRTSIEWCDSKGSADLYDSIQEADGCTMLHYWNAIHRLRMTRNDSDG